MFSSLSRHRAVTARLCRRTMAVIQLVLVVMMAVPAACYELVLEQGHADACLSAHAFDTGQDGSKDECPCCPDEGPSGADACSTCSNCSFYTPFAFVPSVSYLPCLARLEALEPLKKLTEVHIPIFVPPQNHA